MPVAHRVVHPRAPSGEARGPEIAGARVQGEHRAPLHATDQQPTDARAAVARGVLDAGGVTVSEARARGRSERQGTGGHTPGRRRHLQAPGDGEDTHRGARARAA